MNEYKQLKAQLEQAQREQLKSEQQCADALAVTIRERDQAQAACAQKDGVLHLAKEMTRPGFHPNPYRGLEHTHFDLHRAIENALSASCGQHYINVDELDPTIELLDKAVMDHKLTERVHHNMRAELARLKSLKEKCK